MDPPHETSPPPSASGDEINSNLNSIVEIAEKWLVRLRRRRKQVKLATAILTTLLVFVGVAGAAFAYIVTQLTLSFFYVHPKLVLLLLATIGVLAIICGVGSYKLQGRKQDESLDELASLITQMKLEQPSADSQPINADVLSIAEKILNLLPEVVRKRNQDSFLFGILAFVITIIPAKLPLALLIGVLVWLYFRYEMNKGYDKEITRFEEQKQLFERRKNEFMQTL